MLGFMCHVHYSSTHILPTLPWLHWRTSSWLRGLVFLCVLALGMLTLAVFSLIVWENTSD